MRSSRVEGVDRRGGMIDGMWPWTEGPSTGTALRARYREAAKRSPAVRPSEEELARVVRGSAGLFGPGVELRISFGDRIEWGYGQAAAVPVQGEFGL